MILDTDEGRALITSATLSIVEQCKPNEVPLYPLIRDQYFKNPQGFKLFDEVDDDVLGFGSSAAIQSFTHSVFPITTPILAYLHTEALKVFDNEDLSLKWLNSLFAVTEDYDPIFYQPQLKMVCKKVSAIAMQEVARLGYNEINADMIVDFFQERLGCMEGE